MLRMLAASAAFGLAAAPALAQDAGGELSPLTFEDVFRLEIAADPQISPDGRVVAYQRRSNDIMTDRTRSTLWRVDADGSDHRPLVAGALDYASPRWSPDGERVAFTASGEDGASLHVVWPETGATARLADLPFGASGLAWSPDGAHLAFTMFRPAPETQIDIGMPTPPPGAQWADSAIVDETIRYEFDGQGEIPAGASQIWVISADGGAPRAVTDLADGAISGFDWSADGTRIVYGLSATEAGGFDFNESDLFEIALDGGEPARLTDRSGVERAPNVSPDGGRIAFLGHPNRGTSHHDANLYVMDRESGEITELLAELDRPIAQAEWAPDGRGLFVRYEDEGRMTLGYVRAGGGEIDVLSDDLGGLVFGRPYTSGAFSVSDTGRYAATLGGPQRLADVGVGGRRGQPERVTDLNADVLGERDLARVERFTWESSADGREIEGWVAYPPGFTPDRTWPMILEIHGGPHTAYGPIFSGEVQLFAAAGYVVFYTNPRGSTSYGEDFANLIDKAYPGEDVDDLLSGIDALVAEGFIDPDRLFVTGGSGGGVLTAELIGVSDRFAAAAVGKPVINWTSFALAADIGPVIYKYWFGATPWEDPDAYWERSPLSEVGSVTTPTLVFVGAEDRRTPVFEAEQYYNALQILGVESRLVRIPGTFHGIADSRPSRLLQKAGHILAWFEDHDPAAEAD